MGAQAPGIEEVSLTDHRIEKEEPCQTRWREEPGQRQKEPGQTRRREEPGRRQKELGTGGPGGTQTAANIMAYRGVQLSRLRRKERRSAGRKMTRVAMMEGSGGTMADQMEGGASTETESGGAGGRGARGRDGELTSQGDTEDPEGQGRPDDTGGEPEGCGGAGGREEPNGARETRCSQRTVVPRRGPTVIPNHRCWAEVMESVPTEMAALGRPLFPGMLYDCRKDSFIPGGVTTYY
ncbi:hypothetical protein cypCar_00040056 [Cyprinus carpio]|nr:hypothetical protein cypCar_00040056 [Cyprinus carpio]